MSSELKLFYSREDYEHAIRDAGTAKFWFGCAIGAALMFALCLLLGYYTS